MYAENKGNNLELEKLQEENKALQASLSKQGPTEGDKSDTKVLKISVFKNDVMDVLINYACICFKINLSIYGTCEILFHVDADSETDC